MIRHGDLATVLKTPSKEVEHRGVSVDEVRVAIMKGRLDTIRELYLAGELMEKYE